MRLWDRGRNSELVVRKWKVKFVSTEHCFLLKTELFQQMEKNPASHTCFPSALQNIDSFGKQASKVEDRSRHPRICLTSQTIQPHWNLVRQMGPSGAGKIQQKPSTGSPSSASCLLVFWEQKRQGKKDHMIKRHSLLEALSRAAWVWAGRSF